MESTRSTQPESEMTDNTREQVTHDASHKEQTLRQLHLLPLSSEVSEMYANHGSFHIGDSGLDLFSSESVVVKPGATEFIKLGVKAAAYNEEGRNVGFLIFPRSSISKTPLRIANSIGLVDAGYRGELAFAVDNIKSEAYEVRKGDRLVQAVFFNGEPFQFKIVESLPSTHRGSRGWGSTQGVAGTSGEVQTTVGPKEEVEPLHHHSSQSEVQVVGKQDSGDQENLLPPLDDTTSQVHVAKKRSSSGSGSPNTTSEKETTSIVHDSLSTDDVGARKKQRMGSTSDAVQKGVVTPAS